MCHEVTTYMRVSMGCRNICACIKGSALLFGRTVVERQEQKLLKDGVINNIELEPNCLYIVVVVVVVVPNHACPDMTCLEVTMF